MEKTDAERAAEVQRDREVLVDRLGRMLRDSEYDRMHSAEFEGSAYVEPLTVLEANQLARDFLEAIEPSPARGRTLGLFSEEAS